MYTLAVLILILTAPHGMNMVTHTQGGNNSKKYQPLLDEVKQRRQKVLSLVKKGVLKIGDPVKQSEVSESTVRRYLAKAGYKVAAGIVSS